MAVKVELNTKEFQVDLDAWAKKFQLTSDQLIRSLAVRLFENIVRRTPVGNPRFWKINDGRPDDKLIAPPGYVGGNARNNWYLGINNRPTAEPTAAPDLENASQSNAQIAGAFSAAAGDVLYFANRVPYIEKLESGTGSPRQAPEGMVELTFEEAKVFYSNLENVPKRDK